MSQANNIQWIVDNFLFSRFVEEIFSSADHTYTICSKYPIRQTKLDFQFRTTQVDLEKDFVTALNVKRSETANRKSDFFHASNIGEERLKAICDMYGEVYEGKPALGIYNPNTQQIIVLESGEFNYGFVNAMVLGFLSKLHGSRLGTHYAHAACFTINDTGILMIGDHKAGKSTLVSRILSEVAGDKTTDLSLISDDWVLIDDCMGNDPVAHRLSGEYRLDKDTAVSSIAGLSPIFNVLVDAYKVGLSDKASIPASALCEATGHQDQTSTRIDKLILLNPELVAPREQLRWDGTTKKILNASTANVPPLNREQDLHFNDFWSAQISSLESVAINNRYRNTSVGEIARDVIAFGCS